MITNGNFFVVGITALVVSILLTRAYQVLALRWGLVDVPDRGRKIHERAVPVGGGLAVFLATLAAVLGWLTLYGGNIWLTPENHSTFLGLLAASSLLVTVGLIDDGWGLRGPVKLGFQVLAASAVMFSGVVIDSVQIFQWQIHLGVMALPFTMFWLLGAINALNLIDGSDGLAATVGAILCCAIAVMAAVNGYVAESIIAAALVGSLLGFLAFNLPPAAIFLGDTGSMLIGLVAGTLAISGSFKGAATVALTAPLAIWSIPILDSTLAILRRKLTGRSIYSADRGHLHHVLQRRGYTSWRIVCLTAVLCAATATAGVVSVYLKNEAYAVIGTLTVIASLIVGRIFGYAEFQLLMCRVRGVFFPWLATQARPGGSGGRETRVRIQGQKDWAELWQRLVDAASAQGLQKIELSLSIPWLQESYYASWDSHRRTAQLCWKAQVPLMAHGHHIGHLDITGPSEDGLLGLRISRLATVVDEVESYLSSLEGLKEIHENVPHESLEQEESVRVSPSEAADRLRLIRTTET